MNKTPKKPQPTKESMLIAASIVSSGMTKAAIAKELDVEPANVSHWASATRPVPADKAVGLARLLEVEPEAVSAAYAKIAVSGGSSVQSKAASEALRPDLEIARLQNDIHALNLALASMVAVMTQHRPAEAKVVASTIRKSVPRKFRDQGLVHELLTTLDQA
jgi:DNA-binding transcriptional regulator YdaS (Cro superfamily)